MSRRLEAALDILMHMVDKMNRSMEAALDMMHVVDEVNRSMEAALHMMHAVDKADWSMEVALEMKLDMEVQNKVD